MQKEENGPVSHDQPFVRRSWLQRLFMNLLMFLGGLILLVIGATTRVMMGFVIPLTVVTLVVVLIRRPAAAGEHT